MGWSLTSAVCLAAALLTAGCASVPEPETMPMEGRGPEVAPPAAPATETAMPEMAMTSTGTADDRSLVGGEGSRARREVPLVFARTDSIEHEWAAGDGRRMQVVFCLSYSARADETEMAAESVRANWQAAVQRAQAVCETLVPRDELNRMGCEDMLCQQLSDVLFGDGRQRPTGNVERVIWERLVWR
ncbi:MAG: hypothetical protein KDE27_23065 [Planctomycetes bacterium]|nr:hypothetical protein [Planctomycetota bacterium]